MPRLETLWCEAKRQAACSDTAGLQRGASETPSLPIWTHLQEGNPVAQETLTCCAPVATGGTPPEKEAWGIVDKRAYPSRLPDAQDPALPIFQRNVRNAGPRGHQNPGRFKGPWAACVAPAAWHSSTGNGSSWIPETEPHEIGGGKSRTHAARGGQQLPRQGALLRRSRPLRDGGLPTAG